MFIPRHQTKDNNTIWGWTVGRYKCDKRSSIWKRQWQIRTDIHDGIKIR